MNPERRRSQSHSVARSLAAHRAEHGDLSHVRHTVQITSFGGCGTTALSEHLSTAGVDLPSTPGHFPFKHSRRPPDPTRVPKGFRALYLHSDPRNAILSIFRRGIQRGHFRGLNFTDPPPAADARLASIESFVAARIDDFRLDDHVAGWLDRESSAYPVLFLRFDAVTEVWDVVREFVGLPAGFPCLEISTRNSDWRAEDAATRDGLDRMYGAVAARLEALPNAQIR